MFYLVCVILLKYSFEEIFVYGWLLVRVPTPEKLLNKSSRSCSNHVQFTAVVHLHYSLSTLSISDTLCRLIVSDCFLQVLILFKLLLKVNRNGWDYTIASAIILMQCCATFLTPSLKKLILKPRAAPVNSKATTKIYRKLLTIEI